MTCRTCLSNKYLKPLFNNSNNSRSRCEQIYLVCGIKIEANDGLPQSICISCLNLMNKAFKFREQTIKVDKILKKTHNNIKIELKENDLFKNADNILNIDEINNMMELYDSKMELYDAGSIEGKKTKITQIKKEISELETSIKKRSELNSSDKSNILNVRIEDFESSNDSDFMNNLKICNLSNVADRKISIEDFESSDSCGKEFNDIMKKENIKYNKLTWDIEGKFPVRGNRKWKFMEQNKKLLSLAMSPYNIRGPIQCKLCSRELRNLQIFRCHAKTHFEPQFACEDCGKKFINQSHMRYHQQRMHGRYKRLACNQCTYRAVDHLQLQNHLRAKHTGERPFVCDVCGDRFRMRANIAQHMRRHFGTKYIQCDRCPTMFRSKSELTVHQNRVHFLIYSYLCYLCPESYRRLASVRKHLINAHGVTRNEQLSIKFQKTRRCPE